MVVQISFLIFYLCNCIKYLNVDVYVSFILVTSTFSYMMLESEIEPVNVTHYYCLVWIKFN